MITNYNVIWDFLVQEKLFWSKKIMNISVFVFFPSRHPNSPNYCPNLMFFMSNHTYYSRETISKCLNQSGLPLRGSKTTLKLRYDVIFHRLYQQETSMILINTLKETSWHTLGPPPLKETLSLSNGNFVFDHAPKQLTW